MGRGGARARPVNHSIRRRRRERIGSAARIVVLQSAPRGETGRTPWQSTRQRGAGQRNHRGGGSGECPPLPSPAPTPHHRKRWPDSAIRDLQPSRGGRARGALATAVNNVLARARSTAPGGDGGDRTEKSSQDPPAWRMANGAGLARRRRVPGPPRSRFLGASAGLPPWKSGLAEGTESRRQRRGFR